MAVKRKGKLSILSGEDFRDIENQSQGIQSFVKDTLPKSTVRSRDKELLNRIQKLNKEGKIDLGSSGAPIKKANQFRLLKSQVGKMQKVQNKMQFQLSDMLDPTGSILSKFSGAAKAILPVGIVLSVAQKVYTIIEENYGRGGIADRSKKERNAVKSVVGLERENIVLSGEGLFLGDVTLIQGVPAGRSNTETLKFGTRLFNLRQAGYQGID